jgi:hypothetical protein
LVEGLGPSVRLRRDIFEQNPERFRSPRGALSSEESALYAVRAIERDTLAKAVRNFVQLGVQNGSENFMSLRGHATDKDNNFFDTNVSFGEFLKTCDVDMLECDTPSLGGSKSDIEAVIHSAIVAALPGGFASTTDPTYLGLSDYRWDRSSDTIAVEVSSHDNGDGTTDYHVEIYHFTT